MKYYKQLLDQKKSFLPYGNIAFKLLDGIFKSLDYCIQKVVYQHSFVRPNDPSIIANFSFLSKELDPHIRAGLFSPEGIKNNTVIPRISSLITQSFYEAISERDLVTQESIYPIPKPEENAITVFIPSPLKLLFDVLTVPNFPESAAYSLATCRTILFARFRIHPETKDLEKDWRTFNQNDILDAISVFRTYIKGRDNIGYIKYNEGDHLSKLFLLHYLAMKGYFKLRFVISLSGGKLDKKPFLLDYCSSRNIDYCRKNSREYEFRLAKRFADIPEPTEVVNELFGVPLPIRGLDTVFFGGLKMSSNSGLVINIGGDAGTGKTSLALAFAAALSPLKTITYHISTEEDVDDIGNRLSSITPSYLNKLSCFESDSSQWFSSRKVSRQDYKDISEFSKGHIRKIEELLNQARNENSGSTTIPALCPVCIVVDSITGFFENDDKNQYENLSSFVDQCRKLNAIVLLLSSERLAYNYKLDFLVDVVIYLKYEGAISINDKPYRVLQLLKTRHQMSRPGAHIFHLSGIFGFRISPQLPSQLDKKDTYSQYDCSNTYIIDTLNLLAEPPPVQQTVLFDDYQPRRIKFIDIFLRSRILIYGHGSSGKAALGLRILMSPIKKRKPQYEIVDNMFNTKILVVSFLYQDQYYQNLRKPIWKIIVEADQDLQKKVKENNDSSIPNLVTEYFYPGFLTPEDLAEKISRKLDEAILEGAPFTGVFLDGLHNVFLQFPKLQDSHMVWPMLYTLFGRYNLTVVTTFTTFTLDIDKQNPETYNQVILKGHMPFLHSLVQASDFYLIIDPNLNGKGDEEQEYLLSVKGAIKQKTPNFNLIWDRSKYSLKQFSF